MNQRARFSPKVSRQDPTVTDFSTPIPTLRLKTCHGSEDSYVDLIPTTMESGPAKGCT